MVIAERLEAYQQSENARKRIRRLLAVRRLSIAWLARQIGANYYTLHSKLSGYHPLRQHEIEAIAAALQVDYKDLVAPFDETKHEQEIPVVAG